MNEGLKRVYIFRLKYEYKIFKVIDNKEFVFKMRSEYLNPLRDSFFHSVEILGDGLWAERDYFNNWVVRWYREYHNKMLRKEQWRGLNGRLY